MKLLQKTSTILISNVSSDHRTLSRQALFTQDSGRVDSVTDLVSRLGQMGPNTVASGVRTEPTAKVDSSTSMVTFMTAIGPTTKPMDGVSTST